MSTTTTSPAPTQSRLLVPTLILNGLAYVTVLAVITGANVAEESGSLIRWTIQCLPLLIVLPGLIMRRYRAYSWLCFIVVLYFIPAVLKTMAPQGHWSDALLLAATCTLFITCAFSSRWLQRVPQQNSATSSDHNEDSHE